MPSGSASRTWPGTPWPGSSSCSPTGPCGGATTSGWTGSAPRSALLAGDPAQARAAAERALDAAEAASAPRHVAKSLLFAGVAATSHGQQAAAVDLLARAAVLAEGLGARPLVWPSRGLLGALLAGSSPTESERSLEAARTVIRGIAADLPPLLAAEWLARRDIRALLG